MALTAGGYVYLREDDSAAGGGDKAAGQPTAPGPATQSAQPTNQSPAQNPAGSPAAGSPSAAAPSSSRTYKAVIENQAFALRWPSTGYTRFDLDTPSALPSGSTTDKIELTYAMAGGPSNNYEFVFNTPTGLSDSTSPDQCRTAVGANALSGRVDAKTAEKEFTVGRILCTVTQEGKLAMVQIERVETNDGKPDYFTRLTVWNMP